MAIYVATGSPGGGLPVGGGLGQVVTNSGSGTGEWEWPLANMVRVQDHGAKGDLILGTEATTNGTTAVTLADASLTVADEGKTICINQAGTSSGVSWTTTISSVTDATHCVVASAPPESVSNMPYAYGTDDTTAFQNAIAAGVALGTLAWTLLLDDLAYMIAGAFQTTNDGNSQILLPYVSNELAPMTIEVRSTSWRPQPFQLTPANGRVPMIFSAQTGQAGFTFSTSVGVPSVFGGPASRGPFPYGETVTDINWICPVFRGITFIGPHWMLPTCLDLGCAANAVVEDCWFATNEENTSNSAGWTTNVGVIMPLPANYNLCSLRRSTAIGLTIGFLLSEHSEIDDCSVTQCVGGIGVPAWPGDVGHLMTAVGLDTEHCTYPITGWDPTLGSHGITSNVTNAALTVHGWTVEDASNTQPYQTVYHANCSGSFRVEVDSARRSTAGGGGPVGGGWLLPSASTAELVRIIDITEWRGPATTPSLPASGTAFSTLWRDSIYVISGGTVTDIKINGTVTGLTSGAILVPSGCSLVIDYSVAPTVESLVIL